MTGSLSFQATVLETGSRGDGGEVPHLRHRFDLPGRFQAEKCALGAFGQNHY